MQHGSLYTSHVAWYPQLDPRADHADECAEYRRLLDEVLGEGVASLLELGGGAGNNATWLAERFTVTVTDLSPRMLALSREANPSCEHIVGDMRTLRLGRTFDAVLVHDAICHMTHLADLRAALETAFVHTRPGGAALVVPDCVRESFRVTTDDHSRDAGGRSLQYVVRMWDPDPTDSRTTTDYALLLGGPGGVEAVHMRHEEGLFSIAEWRALLEEVGFLVEAVPRSLPEDESDGPYWDHLWRCRRPA